jgi:predicted CXXCH cytochrome family protein
VLLSHQGTEADKALVRAVPGIDLVFAAHDRRFAVEPNLVGDTAIFQAGSRGKYLGQVSLDLAEGRSGWSAEAGRAKAERRQASLQRQLTRYREQLKGEVEDRTKTRVSGAVERVEQQLAALEIPPPDDGTHNRTTGIKVAMGRDLADEPVMKKLVGATLEQLGDTVTTDHGHDHSHSRPELGKLGKPHKVQGPYVGAGVCMGCHAGQYADWASTPHAHAWQTLVEEKRQYDQDCWSCHVTAAKKPGGPAHPKAVGSMRNVQCEVCHGPGEKHVAAPSKAHMLRSPPEKLCVTCHNMEQTEGRFVFEDYRAKIDHRP